MYYTPYSARTVQYSTQYYNINIVPGTVLLIQYSTDSSSINISCVDPSSTPQLFYTYFYNHAHRLRLEKLLYTCIEFPRSSNGFLNHFWIQVTVSLLKPPHGGLRIETAVTRPFRKWNGQKFNGYIFKRHNPTDASARSGITRGGLPIRKNYPWSRQAK
jgi:hypothetical protein